jgi:response regulator RpfG family c-di-GMP phosphodiesterase
LSDKILFVEPRRELQPQAARSLEGLGALEFVQDGAEALAALGGRGPYAVFVCDYQSAKPTGRELVARARELAPALVIVVQSKRVEVDVVIEALHAGRISRFLERPAPLARVREAVEAALAEHRLLVDASARLGQLDFSSKVLTDFNGRLEQRVEQQTAALAHWQRFAAGLNACRALEEIARVTGEAAGELCPGRGVFIELWDGTLQGQRCHFVAGPALADRRHVQTIGTPEGQVGSLVVASRDGEGRSLSKMQRSLLASIASSCAVAAHNQIRRLERDEAQQATLLALAKLAEQRDNETGKHLERVSLYCRRIAEGLRAEGFYSDTLSDEWIADLVRSAPLHDIGKVGIPDSILLKPGKLDAREWEIMQTHAELGARTLESVIVHQEHAQTFLEMSMRIAWCHHEKWDGSGYPRGLSGEEIPLEARILALADVYDALTSRRPYKEAWTHAEAMKWVAEAAGAHFDPPLVRVFVRQHKEIDAIRERLADTEEDLARLLAQVA